MRSCKQAQPRLLDTFRETFKNRLRFWPSIFLISLSMLIFRKYVLEPSYWTALWRWCYFSRRWHSHPTKALLPVSRPIDWPPGIPALTLQDLFLQGFVKEKLFSRNAKKYEIIRPWRVLWNRQWQRSGVAILKERLENWVNQDVHEFELLRI